MLWTINKSTRNETQSIQAENQDSPSAADRAGGGEVGGSFENLSIAAKLAKSKKSKLTKSKKSDLPKINFVRVNSGTDYFTLKAKKAFIYLWKAFIETLILRHFDPERYIQIEIDVPGYAIGRVLSQITSDQHSSNHVTNKDLNSPKSKIGQWHPVAFFSWKMIPTET